MNDRGYHYSDVPDILASLQAEGLALSVNNVYERRARRGSNQSISADTKRWKREHGLIEGSGEDQKDTTPGLLPAMPESLPEPDPERVASELARYRARVTLTIAQSHLQAALAALRCVDEVLPTVILTMNAEHAQRETRAGVHPNHRTTPPYWPALGILARHGAEVRGAMATLWQAVTLVTAEGTNHEHGHGRPAA